MARTRAPSEVIAIASGKGGVGKTNLSLNLGIELSRQGTRTILLDADLGHANADILLDVQPRADLTDMLDPWCSVAELLTRGPHGLGLLCGISGLRHRSEICEIDPAVFVRTLRRVRRSCDLLLIDCGAGAPGPAASFALSCDRLILITTPEPTAIADTYATLKLLYQRGFCARVGVIVNMVRRESDAVGAVRRLQRVSEEFLGLSLENLGFVTFDRHVITAVHQRLPFVVSHPRCQASRQIEALARRLRPRRHMLRVPQGWWGRVASLFF